MREHLRKERREKYLPLVIILGAFAVLGLIYTWATPPLEASDELWHFGMVDTIADTGELPVQHSGVETQYEQEGSQPPLYYLVAAALVRPIDRSDFDVMRQPNPHVKPGIPGASDNKNLVLHDTPHPLLEKTALAVYVLRLFGILLGCVTVTAVYMTALTVSGNSSIAILAAGLTAFNPMFLFISASVNNDNLVTALNSLAIWQIVFMLRDGFSAKHSIALAILLALASLSKLSALVLIPVAACAALLVAYRRKQWRSLVILGFSVAVLWLSVAGWWYIRNLTLYGELFGTRTMVAVAGPRLEPFTLGTWLGEFEGFLVGYWGWFGGVNITTAQPFYLLMNVITGLALIGLIWIIVDNIRRYRQRLSLGGMASRDYLLYVALLGSIVAIGFVSFLTWTAQTYASQGRLLFPFIAAISTLTALGLSFWLRTKRVKSLLPLALALVALVIPFATIAPQYAPPPPLTALPDTVRPVYARFGDVALLGYETPDQRYQPGDQLPITVYWEVLNPSDRDLSLYLHAVNPAGDVIGRIDSFPGAGRLRTTTWQPGAIYADSYRIPLDLTAEDRYKLRVQVGWWHYASGDVVQPIDENGALLESVMLDAGAFVGQDTSDTAASLMPTERVAFGGVIALTGHRLDGDSLTLAWDATGISATDYTIFVQVLDDANNLVTSGDAPPALPTHYWRTGEHYVTQHTLTYSQPPAPGTYRVLVGWYEPQTLTRLDTAAPDDAYVLTTITR
jgi:4-amino-4-deoxy-L-arabinose transferase-like glycosyltransferase